MKVIFYTSASGRDEISHYLVKLSARTRAECNAVIEELRFYGLNLPAPFMKKLSGQQKLWELRIKAEVQHRILFTVTKNKEAILLNAFIKKNTTNPAQRAQDCTTKEKTV